VEEEYREHMEDMKSRQEKEMKDLAARHRSESTNMRLQVTKYIRAGRRRRRRTWWLGTGRKVQNISLQVTKYKEQA
jgi:hypothetical protein